MQKWALLAALLSLLSSPSANADGFEWSIQQPYDVGALTETPDGGYILGMNKNSVPSTEIVIRKISRSGKTEWDYAVGNGGQLTNIAVDRHGNTYATGFISSDLYGEDIPLVGAADAFLISVSPKGKRRFVRRFGSDGDENFYGIAVTGGQVLISGWTQYGTEMTGEFPIPSSAQIGVIARYSTNGDLQNVFYFENASSLDSIASLPNGDIVTGGSCGDYGVALWRIRPDGEIIWEQHILQTGYAALFTLLYDRNQVHALVYSGEESTFPVVSLEVHTGKEIGRFDTGMPTPRSLAILSGGRIAVSGSDKVGLFESSTIKLFQPDGDLLEQIRLLNGAQYSTVTGMIFDKKDQAFICFSQVLDNTNPNYSFTGVVQKYLIRSQPKPCGIVKDR